MNQPNLEDLLRLGKQAAEDGNKETARMIFQQILDTDKRHVGAWLWMAFLAQNRLEQRKYLTQVIQIDPTNEKARSQLKKLDDQIEGTKRSSIGIGMRILILMIISLVLMGLAIFVVSRLAG